MKGKLVRDLIYEALAVLSYRARSLWCLIAGVVCAGALQIVGRFLINDLDLTSPYAPMTQAIQMALWERYDKVSLGILIAATTTGATVFLRDRKRFLRDIVCQ